MRSQESVFSGELVKLLNKHPKAHFRKTSDKFQVGLPDIIGCLDGIHVEIEVKHEAVLDTSKKMPTGHYFTGAQMKELRHITNAGGVALGIIAAGNTGFVFGENLLKEDGRIILNDYTMGQDIHKIILPNIEDLIWLIKTKSDALKN